MDLDDALVKLGDFGHYQNLIFWLVSIPGNFFPVFHNMATVFIAAWPDSYYCSIPEGSYMNDTIPVEDWDENGQPIYDGCSMYVNKSVDNSTTSCTNGWDYVQEQAETIISEWDLVCDSTILAQLSQSIYMIGVMFGCFICGYLADKFGRKCTYLRSLWAVGIVGTLTAFTQNFVGFCILRFCAGILQSGVLAAQFTLATEMFTPSKRTYAGFLSCMAWALAVMILAPIAYVCTHWRVFQIVISAPALLTFYYYWVVPESMRWLISQDRSKDAENVLYTAAKFNGVSLPPNVLTSSASQVDQDTKVVVNGDITTDSKEVNENDNYTNGRLYPNVEVNDTEGKDIDENYNFLDLFRTPRMALYTFVMGFSWFVSGLVYYGLSYNTMHFEGSTYALFFLAGCVEIPAYAVSMFFIAWWGRRWPSCIFLILSGVTCTAIIFVPEETGNGDSLSGFRIFLLLIGKFAITGAYGTVYVWAPELYPTLLRNIAFGSASFAASVGGVIAPLTVYVAHYNVAIAMSMFGILSLVSGVTVLLLPETKDKLLPRNIKEAENLWKAPTVKQSDMNKTRHDKHCNTQKESSTQTDFDDEFL
ncbi:organic cation transporter protein-like [Glandiceps talaboti]